jgi:RsiW-degrading membrane proteinase PrsW (M82 family)
MAGTDRRSHWVRKSVPVSYLVTFIVLAVFLGLAFLAEGLLKPVFSGLNLVWVGIGMSLVPAMAWLFFFYVQDRREPEPKGLVIEIFILGALVAGAVGIPTVNTIFNISGWLYDNFWVNLAGSILVVGFTQEFLKFAAVRFSIFNSAEFDEHTDGIIYATAAGLGYATAMNIDFIVSSNGAGLGMAAIRLVLTALAQASFAGVTGYFLGREKLEKMPLWWLPAGLSLAAVLNGLFFVLWGELTMPSLHNGAALANPWIGLALAGFLALAVMVVLSLLIRRDQRRSAELVQGGAK